MQYLLLLYGNEAEPPGASEAAAADLREARRALAAELARAGRPLSLHSLVSTASATTIRLRGGERLVCDGPFAETSEQLLGLLVVEALDLDEAIAIAERAPEARAGSVEIRPVRSSP